MSKKIVQEKQVYSAKKVQKSLSREELNQKIRDTARRLYEKRGGAPGHELDDWLEAEKIVNKEFAPGI